MRSLWMVRLPLLLLAALPVGLVPGCSNPGGGPAGKKKPRIALVMKSLANEFFTTMADGARKHHDAHPDDYDLVVNGIKDEQDVQRQMDMVSELVAQQVDALVIAPADSKILVTACKRAKDQGVVVINIDNKLDDATLAEAGLQVPFVGPDNRAGARMIGDYLAKHLKRGDEVAILEGVPTAFNAQQRRLGFEDAMKEAGMRVVSSQSAQWEMNRANTVASAMLNEHPDLKALLCSNDSMALGALAAVKAAGRVGRVQIVGFDNISAIRQAVKDGSVLATADQHADQLAVFGIEYALRVLRGETTPADQKTPVDLITAESLR
jgi:ribose transport system substrate-binding protein